MEVIVAEDKDSLGKQAAKAGASIIRAAIKTQGHANIIVATGASQFEVLDHLLKEPDINWTSVTGFHLDEYVGLPITHPASFRAYLWQRFVSKLPTPMNSFHFIDAEKEPEIECSRVGAIIADYPVNVAFIGIGENAHIAFNDPPADFNTNDPYIVVDLDLDCRKQQLGEGWFPNLEEVPQQAISMSVHQIMKSETIICSVPDERKSIAVTGAVTGEVTNQCPASILQTHPDCRIFLDPQSSSNLSPK